MDIFYRFIKIVFVAVLIWVGVEAAVTIRATRATEATASAKIAAIQLPNAQPALDAIQAKVTALKLPNTQPLLDAAQAKIEALKLPDTQPLLAAAQAKVDGVKLPDAQPTLDQAKAVLKDTQDTMDSWYDDATALLQSMAVTTAQVGQMSETINKATPKMTDAAVKTEKHVEGIAGAGEQIAKSVAAPKTTLGKVWGVVKSLAGLARFF